MRLEAYLLELITEEKTRSCLDRMVLLALTVLEWFYRGVVALRWALFCWGILPSRQLPVPVIAVGNLAAGGTGKTPFTVFLARHLAELAEQGYRPAVLIRGYRGQGKGVRVVADTAKINYGVDETGDEAQLLARSLPGIPVVAGADRYQGGLAALQLGADVLIMDDGFQHLALRRDRDIVLLDAKKPFENGHLLPRGLLREGKNGLCRAHLVVLSGNSRILPEQWQELCAEIRRRNSKAPLIRARIQPIGLQTLSDWWAGKPAAGSPEGYLAGRSVGAFTAIGRPEKFFATLEELGARLEKQWTRPDHYRWQPADFSPEQIGATDGNLILVTTEKDAVKLDFLIGTPWTDRIYVLPVRPLLTEADLKIIDTVLNPVLKGLTS